jgi:hypothetical protein
VIATLNIPAENFTTSLQGSYVRALAAASSVSVDMITLIKVSSVEGARRNSGDKVQVQCSIATSDSSAALAVSRQLDASRLNTQIAAQGLPPAELMSVSVLASSQSSGTPEWMLVSWLVGSLVLVVLGLIFAALCILYRRNVVTGEEKTLQVKISEIRKLLRLCKSDGYFVGSERPGYWEGRRGAAIYLRQSQLDAAGRFALFQDFDMLQFNAFCIVLEGGLDEDARKRYIDLTLWIVETAAALIRPSAPGEEKTLPPGVAAGAIIEPLSAAERFRIFEQKVIKARIWTDDPSLFLQLQLKAQGFMDDIALECDLRYQRMCGLPHGDVLVAFQSPCERQSQEGAATQAIGAVSAPAAASYLIRRQDHQEVRVFFAPCARFCSRWDRVNSGWDG